MSIYEALKRNTITFEDICEYYPEYNVFSRDVLKQVEIMAKYEGYLVRQQKQIEQSLKQENTLIPENINYDDIKGLRKEAQQKLNQIKPLNVGQASRISGISPADISVLIVYLKTYKRQ